MGRNVKVGIIGLLFLVVLPSTSSLAQENLNNLLGVWVCDSMEQESVDSLMIDGLVVSFFGDNVLTVELLNMPSGFEDAQSKLNGTWSLKDSLNNEINFCLNMNESEEQALKAEDCEVLSYTFISPNYLKLTDGEEPLFFRRE